MIKVTVDKYTTEAERRSKCNEVYFNAVNFKGPFINEIKAFKVDKSYNQLAGIHLLCERLVPRLTETQGIPFDKESAKHAVKRKFKFTEPVNDYQCNARLYEWKEDQEALGLKVSLAKLREQRVEFKRTLTEVRSFATATLEEMQMLIREIEALGEVMGWPEVKLESQYVVQMLEFYNLKEK